MSARYALTIELSTGLPRVPPREIRLFKWGKNSTRKGIFTLTQRGAEKIMENYAAHNSGDRPILIDWEHDSLRKGGAPDRGKAAGWADLQLRDDGIWLTRIEWKQKAREYLSTGEYRYFSPAFDVNRDEAQCFELPTDEIVDVINCALTNLPATDRLQAMVAASRTSGVECVIRKEGGKFVLYDSEGKKKLGTHPTRAAAEKQEAAINISKARAAGHHIPKKSSKVANSDETDSHEAKSLAREKTMKAHPLAKHLKEHMAKHELSHEAMAKKMGMKHDRLKKLTAGHPPTEEEMSLCMKKMGRKGAGKKMGVEPTDSEHKKFLKDDEEHEENSFNGLPTEDSEVPDQDKQPKQIEAGGSDNADENQNGKGPDEETADETDEEPATHHAMSRDGEDEEEEQADDETSEEETTEEDEDGQMVTLSRGELAELRRKSVAHDRIGDTVEKLRRDSEDKERKELITLAQSKNMSPNQIQILKKGPIKLFRQMVEAADERDETELLPLAPRAIGKVTLSREEIQINELTGGDLEAYAAYKETMNGAPAVTLQGTRVVTTLSRANQKAVYDSFIGRTPAKNEAARE